MPSWTKDTRVWRQQELNGNPYYDYTLQTNARVSKNWTNTPNFRSIKASGGVLPNNPFTFFQASAFGGGLVGDNGVTRYSNNGTFVPFPSAAGIDSGLVSQVQLDLINKAKGSQWNVPIFVAEGRKTVDMVASRARHLAWMAWSLKRGRFDLFFEMFHDSVSPPGRRRRQRWKNDFGKDASKAASNIWLEASYGWVPFMSDVRSSVITLMDVMDRPESRVGTVTSKRTRSSIYKTSESLFYAWSNRLLYSTGTVYDSQSCKATWQFRNKDSEVPGRFGLLNPLEVAWELVPFSFVADWFLPIGDYLSSLDAPFRFQHLGGTIGGRRETTIDYTVTRRWPSSAVFSGGRASTNSVYVTRSPMASIPNPRLATLAFEPNLGVARTISGISLLRQQLARFR